MNKQGRPKGTALQQYTQAMRVQGWQVWGTCRSRNYGARSEVHKMYTEAQQLFTTVKVAEGKKHGCSKEYAVLVRVEGI